MARPRKTEAPMEPATERVFAPETVAAVQSQVRIERVGSLSEPYVHHYPQIRGGVCEFCGILDPNTPSQYQYKLCPHYRGMSLRCSYCPSEKDPDEVIRSTKLEVVGHPDRPGVLIAVCSSYDCEKRHQERWRMNG